MGESFRPDHLPETWLKRHAPTVRGVADPLTGFTIAITGHRRWEEQAEMLTGRGAAVLHGPVMHTSLLHDVDATVLASSELIERGADIVVLTTGIGTRSWFGAAESAGLDGALREACDRATVFARGPKARSAAIGCGLTVDWHAPGETGEEVVDHLVSSASRGSGSRSARRGSAAHGRSLVALGRRRHRRPGLSLARADRHRARPLACSMRCSTIGSMR